MSAAVIRNVYVPSAPAVACAGRRRPPGRIRRRGDAHPDHPAPVAAGRRLRPVAPPEPLGALPQACDQVAGRERVAALGIDRRLVADAQLDRIDAAGDRQLVERGLEREHAGALARRAHPRRRRQVERDQAVGGPPGRRGVHHPRRERRLLGELLHRRGLLDDVVGDRLQPAVAVGAELQALDGRRAVAGEGEHLLAGDGELDRAIDVPGAHRREHHVWPRRPLRAEPAADVRRDDPYPVGVEAEHLGHRRDDAPRALRRVVQVQTAAGPGGDRGVRLHRVVVLRRGGVRRVHGHLGAFQGGRDVALLGVGGEVRVDLVGLVQTGMVGPQLDVVRRDLVDDAHDLGGVPGGLERVGDRRRDDLAAIGDARGLEHRQLARGVGQLLRVFGRQHAEHAGDGQRLGGVDRRDDALGDRRWDDRRIGDAVGSVLVGVAGRPHHLVVSLDPLERRSERTDGDAHRASSSSVRTSSLRASSTL